MSLSNITSGQLRILISQLREKESLVKQLAKIDAAINSIDGGKTIAEKKTRSLVRKGKRRGGLRDAILESLPQRTKRDRRSRK